MKGGSTPSTIGKMVKSFFLFSISVTLSIQLISLNITRQHMEVWTMDNTSILNDIPVTSSLP
ncbi:hypothetical protein DQK91_10285 [Oceanidesulfovibrio marinus]|uniref:Uncharacterized protein n=1 Tax=Oceanidesulfovibrio marinus TaxID=370038 RepID=A0A6P1ZH71_9BACT|nr:hypothetical protein DQK91_10285 [Oceanidesulfovibrio marinus]